MGTSIADNDLDDDDFSETHDINVTPFIDVILVLLIIFMVAAPLSTVDLPIDLPTSSAMPQKKPDRPTYVSIKSDLALAVGENPVKRTELIGTLDGIADMSKEICVPARRPCRALRRVDGRDGNPARRRLFSGQAGGARSGSCGGWAVARRTPALMAARCLIP